MSSLRYDGLVVLVTGAGAGLGRQYALDFAARGASVVVNDLGGGTGGDGSSSKPADHVVNQIIQNGGRAVANYDSVEFGEKLVKTAIDSFGKIDIVINNAGILRDRSFVKMSEGDWDIIHKVHLKGAFAVTKAAWSYMKEQKFGRIIFTASPSGLYGNFGQANYSAAKLGLLGFANTLNIEGQRYNIKCNTIAPTASSRLTESVLPPELHEHLKAEYISPLVLYLCHPETEESGSVFELAGGWIAKMRWQRSEGVVVRKKGLMTPEMVRDHFQTIADFSANSTFPTDIRIDSAAHVASIMENLENEESEYSVQDSSDPKLHRFKPSVFEYSAKDVQIYALSVGAKPNEDGMKFVYEQDDGFCTLPTYSVIPSMMSLHEFITNPPEGLDFDVSKLLHGEHYTELFKPLPTNGTLRNEGKIVDVLQKGSGSVVIIDVNSYDDNDDLVAFNQFVTFIVGAQFGEKKKSSIQIPLAEIPNRKPDQEMEERIAENQAALYRLNGDLNPLHIDPAFAAMGGQEQPILHGLCGYAIACRHILKTYADNDVTKFKSMKVRFSKPVFMGNTIRTEMWREGKRIHFRVKNLDTGKICIDGGFVELHDVTTAENDVTMEETLASEKVFEQMRERLIANPELAKKVNAVFLWNITKNDMVMAKFTVDFRGGEPVYKGEPKTGKVACTFTVADHDMVDLFEGKLNPQKAFMSGKLKIRGNLGLVQKLDGLFRQHSKL